MRIIRELISPAGRPVRIEESTEGIRWLVIEHPSDLTLHIWRDIAVPEYCEVVLLSETTVKAALGDVVLASETAMKVVLRDEVDDVLAGQDLWTEVKDISTYLSVRIQVIEARKAPKRRGGFVHLHTHSEYSPLDGLSRMSEIMEQVVADDQPALGITDHGTCSGHPELQRVADKNGVKPIFGLEAYFCDEDRTERPQPGDPESQKRLKDGYFHLVLMAQNAVGLRNLWALSTESHRTGFFYRPRIDWEGLQKYSEGLICSTACLRGPLSVPILADDETLAQQRLARLLQIFDERLYLEIHSNHLPEQGKVNNALVAMGKSHGVPLLGVVDSHYPTKSDYDLHHIWIACQTQSDVQDEGDLFAHDLGLYVQTEAEVRENLSYLGSAVVDEAVSNTLVVANRCDAVIKGKQTTPTYYRQSGPSKDSARLREMCEANWHKVVGKAKSEEIYRARFEREFALLESKQFCGYFLMVANYCQWSKENGILVGPGRGSGGGSLVAYLVSITEIDPVDTDLLFERFLTEGRTSLPDFDVDFPTSKRGAVQEYLRERWGWDHTLRIGTHLRLKNKGIVGQLFSTLASQLPPEAFTDARKVSALINDAEAGTAGLGLSWEELWAQAGETLEPYRLKYPELFATAERLVGRLKSYGKHAAGIVISTEEPLTGRFPLRGGEDGESMISQFEMDDLEKLGLVKFDILTLRTLDTLQEAVDLIKERQGIVINPYAWGPLEYSDPAVWAELADAHTMGIFQFETTSGTKLTRRYRPDSVADLANITAIVRPGPMRSGLTEAYLRRRAGDEPITYPDPRLEEVLVKTYGTLIYQEDIMQTCMILAGYGSDEADGVRKILGKKKVDQVVEAGHKFVDRCVANGMDKSAASLLWDQMAEFAKYSFGKAHAYAYAMLAYWCAWLKVHFPVEFLTAAMSTVDKERVPDFIKEARRIGVEVLPPDINASGRGFRPDGSAIRYGLDAIKGVGAKAVLDVEAGQPYASFEDYLARKGKNANSGVTRLLAKVGAFDSVEPHRKALVARLEAEHDGSASQCVFKVIGHPGPNGLPCTYDWEGEPRPVNQKTGKKLKAKPVPKRCTKGCRQYQAPEAVPIGLVGEYTESEIRQIELDMLQIELSSTAFDLLDPADRTMVREQAELLDKGVSGMYLVVGTITKPRKIRDRNERSMAFFNLATETVEIDVACFAESFSIYGELIQAGKFVAAELRRDERGSQLKTLSVIQD